MKKVLLISILSFGFISSYSQDSSKKQPTAVSNIDTVVVLSVKEANTILNYIQMQTNGDVEVKRETWESIMDLIRNRVRTIPKKN